MNFVEINKKIERFLDSPIAKLLLRPKSFWSIQTFLLALLSGELMALKYAEKITTFCQNQITLSKTIFEEYFWNIIEFVFSNGSWINAGIYILLMFLMTYSFRIQNNSKKSLETLVQELREHTHVFFDSIKTHIMYHDQEITIEHENIYNELQTSIEKYRFTVVTGLAGIGKTGLLKQYYGQHEHPLFIFKATEFNIKHVNEIFQHIDPSFSIYDFISLYDASPQKVIVIDSAEKLPDLNDQEPLKEFISIFVKSQWNVVFTSRYDYLDDLLYMIKELWGVMPKNINIPIMLEEELVNLSHKYDFELPSNQNLLPLIASPFYLNEYLQILNETHSNEIDEEAFKQLLWDRKILSHERSNDFRIEREKCFIALALERANKLSMIVKNSGCKGNILRALEKDGLIGFEKSQNGYFIAHDIYEEWALARYINDLSDCDMETFFRTLGDSLAIRRAFRLWLSKRIDQKKDIKSFLETIFSDNTVANHWKDEIIVAIQLTEQSKNFYDIYSKELLAGKQDLLERIIFLTRVACKEVDNSIFEMFGLKPGEKISMKYVLDKPKGSGWESLIEFLYQNRECIQINTKTIIGLIKEWLQKYEDGPTTRNCGLLGIFYLNKLAGKDGYLPSEIAITLSKIILSSALQIQEELSNIYSEYLSTENVEDSKYENLVTFTLTSLFDNQKVIKSHPDDILNIAKKVWYSDEKSERHYSRHKIEEDFCVSTEHEYKYFPASAFQTPIYWLLKVEPLKTIDFILEFVNKCVECYVHSDLKDEVEEVILSIDGDNYKQFHSQRLWLMYRGGGSNNPELLESIHMALEKWLLEYIQIDDSNSCVDICKYLLKKSKSSSISSVVSSVVMAAPKKMFDVALILFRIKEFISDDTSRYTVDQTIRSLYSIGYSLNNDILRKTYSDERLKTCDDEHRKKRLEDIAFQLQIFKEEGDSDFDFRRDAIANILDEHYKKYEIDKDQTWGLYLARMDARKMDVKTEKVDHGIMLSFEPRLDKELKIFSETSLEQNQTFLKHLSLKTWAESRFQNNQETYSNENYKKYEDDPLCALNETKEIFRTLKEKEQPDFHLMYKSVPAYVCVVLVRDFWDVLSIDEQNFCVQSIIEYASLPISFQNYFHQIGDGIEAAIFGLCEVLKHTSEYEKDIKTLIVLLLLSESTFSLKPLIISVIQEFFWEHDFSFAQAIFFGYLFLQNEKQTKLKEIIEATNERFFDPSTLYSDDTFFNEFETEIHKIVEGNFSFTKILDLNQYDEDNLLNVFGLLPNSSFEDCHIEFVVDIAKYFAERFFSRKALDYDVKRKFLEKYTSFVLLSDKKNIPRLLQPFYDVFEASENASDFFEQFLLAEDKLQKNDNFWIIWNIFYHKIATIALTNCSYRYMEEIMTNYLLAYRCWREDARDWHTLEEKNKFFYDKVVKDFGHCPITLYAISKVLNDIGSRYIDDGLEWIASIIDKHKSGLLNQLKINTVYYLEIYMRKYILKNKSLIRKESHILKNALIILDFLVEEGSSKAYQMRESIL